MPPFPYRPCRLSLIRRDGAKTGLAMGCRDKDNRIARLQSTRTRPERASSYRQRISWFSCFLWVLSNKFS